MIDINENEDNDLSVRASLSSYLNVLVENVEEIRTDMNNLTEKIDDDLNAIVFKVGNAIESIKPLLSGFDSSTACAVLVYLISDRVLSEVDLLITNEEFKKEMENIEKNDNWPEEFMNAVCECYIEKLSASMRKHLISRGNRERKERERVKDFVREYYKGIFCDFSGEVEKKEVNN